MFQIINFYLIFKYNIVGQYGSENRILELIILLRTLRVLNVLKEVKQWQVIIQTMHALLVPFYTLLMVQFMLFYFFAILGDWMFGGLVNYNTPAVTYSSQNLQYSMMNFNDTLASFITLFALLVVNNWFMIAGVFVDITLHETYKIYFIAFYIFSVIMVVNFIVSFVIDMYSSVEALNLERIEQQTNQTTDTSRYTLNIFSLYIVLSIQKKIKKRRIQKYSRTAIVR